MIIKTKIDFKEYLKLMFILTYKKGWTIYLTIMGILMLVSSIFISLRILSTNNIISSIFGLLFGLFIVAGIPFSVYRTAKKNFASNGRLQENIIYDFSNEGMKITGESFNSQLEWVKTYKIEELEGWFIIYQSKQTANCIQKSNLSNEQTNDLHKIFSNLKGITLKLKKQKPCS